MFKNTHTHILKNAYMHALTVSEKQAMTLKESGMRCMERFRVKKGKGNCRYINPKTPK